MTQTKLAPALSEIYNTRLQSRQQEVFTVYFNLKWSKPLHDHYQSNLDQT